MQVVDNAFNVSAPSDPLTITAELVRVPVTWRVLAPPETPPDATLYIAGDNPAAFGAAYDPALRPMTPLGDNVWEYQATVQERTPLLYKYTRGSWETVEQWGAISGFGNRALEVVAGPDGTMRVDDSATDWGSGGPDDRRAIEHWRDPLVAATQPITGTTGPVATIGVHFATPVQAADRQRVISVTAADGATVEGTVAQEGLAFVFTPATPLLPGVYTATAFNVGTDTPMAKPYTWVFTVAEP